MCVHLHSQTISKITRGRCRIYRTAFDIIYSFRIELKAPLLRRTRTDRNAFNVFVSLQFLWLSNSIFFLPRLKFKYENNDRTLHYGIQGEMVAILL